ncbi:hypothetical protein [Leptolyngbya sp. FACHB-711]|jgi:hypothetical protein|uniref:hypothetical protein n=1 Tax=unclassified Leptolyngbya TaxID=2650499 RepID=UPI0016899DDC|nr:hypothetical protein [Leptolyngbya sp. FACHB-711]MBD1852156.1 hypothetical protein [Cyanobacteria bacterium FACHB-502]MBD2027038.1 hypothetical protein [Leptolyngbya sp. FACHB-711]
MNHLPLGKPVPGNRPAPTTSPTGSTEILHVLKYNITALEEGVLLSIWEPAARNDTRVKPFLYMVKYRLPSEADARKLLAHYISAYKTGSLTAHGF